MKKVQMVRLPVIAALLFSGFFGTQRAAAHCDGMDGPVVKAARGALEAGDVRIVLAWVQKDDEAAVREAFTQTQAVRRLNSQAQELADRYFYETVVRIHRAGEGEPYTGLKPAGRDPGLAVESADKAIESGSVDGLVKLLSEAAAKGVRERFQQVRARKGFASGDTDAGREYVKAYVEFIHYAEGLHDAIQRGEQHPERSHDMGKHAAH
ncbi:MAG: hypothetical protein IT167_22975 [Bryobacterales bacterium]|nr:hypothetical protein [Bryobacterales bacterium]